MIRAFAVAACLLGFAAAAQAAERGRTYSVMPGRPGAVKVQRDPLAWRQPAFTVRDTTGRTVATCRPDPLAWRAGSLACTDERGR